MIQVRARQVFEHLDGTVDYAVAVMDKDQPLWNGFVRKTQDQGLAQLLRTIATQYEADRKIA